MKKKIITISLSSIAFLLSIFNFYHSSPLVYVDVNKLVEGSVHSKSIKIEFERKVSTLKANSDTLQAQWKTELINFERDRQQLSSKELSLRQDLLTAKQQQFSSYQEAIQKQIEEADKNATQTVINEINDYVKEYGKQHGYKIIFGANGGGNIMYADESTDLTEEVLQGLNAEYEKK